MHRLRGDAGMTADLSSMEAAYKGKYGYELP